MLIHPWDAPADDAEWRVWLAAHDFGQLAVNGLDGEPPFVQPAHFSYAAGPGAYGEALLHLARPNPLWRALETAPRVTLSVVGDDAYIPGPWHAPNGGPAEHGTPTSYYTAVQLRGVAHVLDDPEEKAELLRRQLALFQPDGGTQPPAVGEEPFGRMLSGIRGVRIEVTDVRAKFKYGGNKSQEVQRRVTGLLARRDAPHDRAARAQQLRRLAAADREA